MLHPSTDDDAVPWYAHRSSQTLITSRVVQHLGVASNRVLFLQTLFDTGNNVSPPGLVLDPGYSMGGSPMVSSFYLALVAGR